MSKMSDGGKGSSPRPFSVSQDEWDNRWDAIFGRDKPKEQETKSLQTEKQEASTEE